MVDSVNSPVSRFTEPGPMSVEAAPEALRSTMTLSGWVLPVAASGPVRSALIWTLPSGLTVSVAFQTRAAFFPPVIGTGQPVSGVPPEVTWPAGIGTQGSASERRQEKAAASYLVPSGLGDQGQAARGAFAVGGLDEAAGAGVEGVPDGLGLVVGLVGLPYLEGVGAVLGRGDGQGLGGGGAPGGDLGPGHSVEGPFEPVVVGAVRGDGEGSGLARALDPGVRRVVGGGDAGGCGRGGGVDREGLPLRPAQVVVRAVVGAATELVRLAVGQRTGRHGHRGGLSGRHERRPQDRADLGVGDGVEDLVGALGLVAVGVEERVAQGRCRGVDDVGAGVGEVRRTGLLLRAGARPVVVGDDQLRGVGGGVGGVDPLPLRGDVLVGGAQPHVGLGGLGRGPFLHHRGDVGVDPAVRLDGRAGGVAAGLGRGGLRRDPRRLGRPPRPGRGRSGGPQGRPSPGTSSPGR